MRVVTATRQATNLQETPIAITAVTAEALSQRGITNMADLTSVVPNAQFRRVQGAFGPGVSAFIRGIGSGDTGLAGEPAVAFYIDDIYYPVLLGANFDLLDIDHIEVLRGPQGTLFGRNSLAGGVNIVGRQPSTGVSFRRCAGNRPTQLPADRLRNRQARWRRSSSRARQFPVAALVQHEAHLERRLHS